MADAKVSSLTNYTNPDRANDVLPIVDNANSATKKVTINNMLGLTSAPVGKDDTQTLTAKTLTAPTISSPVLSGTITGTYTIAGTPTFPSSVATLTGSQTLTNKVLTSPTINAPTITNASLTADAITGFSSANTGTIYGIAITSSKLPGTSITNSTVGANQLNTGAQVATVLTSETTTSTSYADLATTTDSVTVTIGVNGLALVSIYSYMLNNTSGALCFVGFVASGTNTIAVSDNQALAYQTFASNAQHQGGATYLLSGLSTGSTTFKMKYKVATGGSGAGTGTFQYRRIAVVPL